MGRGSLIKIEGLQKNSSVGEVLIFSGTVHLALIKLQGKPRTSYRGGANFLFPL